MNDDAQELQGVSHDSQGTAPQRLDQPTSGGLRKLIGYLVTLFIGGALGVVASLLAKDIGSQFQFQGLMALIAAMAAWSLIAACILAIIKWLAKLMGAGIVLRMQVAVEAFVNKPNDRSWSDHLSIVWKSHGILLAKAIVAAFFFWAGISLLHPVAVGLFSFANYLSSQAQVQAMDSQNRVIAIEQEFQQLNSLAEQRFQQISTILLNPISSPSEQAFALRELPEVMRISVPRAQLEPKVLGGVRRVLSLPNLERLQALLRQYLRTDRVTATLRLHNIPLKKNKEEALSPEAFEVLRGLRIASTELLHVLHRLGPSDSRQPNRCLWNWKPDNIEYSKISQRWGILEVEDETVIPDLRQPLKAEVEATIDLTYLGEHDLEWLCAPFFYEWNWKVFFAPKSSLSAANLQGAHLSHASLSGVDLSECELQGVDLSDADLRGASLRFALMQKANLRNANLEDAFLIEAELEGSDLTGAHLQKASIQNANLKGCNLSGANLRGADLSGTGLEDMIEK